MEAKKLNAKKQMTTWGAILLVVVIAFALFLDYKKSHPSTDDAYVNANIVHVAAQVSGRVFHIYAENYQNVKKGQLLLQIDPNPFQIAVDSAQAKLALAQQGERSQIAQVKSAQAAVTERQADLLLAQQDSRRTFTLVSKGQLSKQEGDHAKNNVSVSQAALVAALNNLRQAQATLGEADQNNANVRAAKADLDQAQLNLSYTRITAPADGKLVNFTVRTGDMIQSGEELFALVEDGQWWVDANYKETQLANIHLGQPASIQTDMYPDYTFKGTVYKISPGSGSAFSVLPAENATGNWVKVTQRVPVKILISHVDSRHPLQVGTSADVTINTSR